MRHFKLALILLLAAPLFGAYQYYYTDTFPSINTTYWLMRGNLSGGSTGLRVAYGYTSGTVTSRVAVPDGSADYEVKATLHLPPVAPGSIWTEYWLNLRENSSGTSFYRVKIDWVHPGYAGNSSASLTVYKVLSGVYYSLGVLTGVPCHENTVVRAVIHGQDLLAYVDNVLYFRNSDSSLSTGMPGAGMKTGGSIAQVELGPIDRTAPAALDPQTINRTSTSNAVHMQWPAASDNTDGVGVSAYLIYRDGQMLDWVNDTSYVDETVSPNQTYSYSIYVEDFHGNRSTAATFQSTTLAAGLAASEEGDGRRTGVRSTGSYWGAGGEQIDTLSGNLNFSLPILKAESRGGGGATLALSYNSQLWRKDSGGVWRMGRDVGYGFGWRLQVGSITPVYLDGQVHHYTFIDGSGAAYRLDVNTSGIWSSKESAYLYYDAANAVLHFPDGGFWNMFCVSAGTEQDSGTRYPIGIQDSNGNQALIYYRPGLGQTSNHTSARISDILDIRSTSYYGGWGSFQFQYDDDPIPHLTGIKTYFAPDVEWRFNYTRHQDLTSPFSPPAPAWTTDFLQSVESLGTGLTHSFEYASASGELTKVVFPLGGYLRWEYRDFSFSDGRTLREVQNRYLKTLPGGSETAYAFARDESDSSRLSHSAGFLNGPSGNGQKAWFFTTNGDSWRIGLQSSYEERPGAGLTSKRKQEYTWTRNSSLNPYVSEVLTTADQGTSYVKQSKTTQVLDATGNVTETRLYGYDSLSTPLRTYSSAYLTGPEYSSRYIFNRLLTSTLTDGTDQLTLVTNTYDTGTLTDVSGASLHDANYGTSYVYRGNITQSVSGATTANYTYDITGTAREANDGQGHSVSVQMGGPNDSAPSLITPNNQSNLSQSYTYNSFLGVTSATGPNSSTVTTAFDSYTRPTSTTSPHGAVTDYTYNNAERTATATTNGRWTRTTTDGLGRTIKVETGYGATTVSTVDTEYDSCGCSPLGKVKRVSQPYAPNGTVYWTVYSYDCLGRTVSVTQPGNSGASTYVYEGNTVTMTNPAGKWKKYTTDALGNLVQVTEPDPALGNVQTNYTYNLRGQLTLVSMPRGGTTQTRTFVYDLPTGRLTSVTNPENGTVSYTYNADGSVATKTDAKNQIEAYTYDSFGRTTQVTRTANGQEDPCGRVNLYYDYNPFDYYFTENGWGRLTALQYGNLGIGQCQQTFFQFRELYSYTAAGLPTKKQLQRAYNPWPEEPSFLQADYSYDNEGKNTSVTYPATAGCVDEYGQPAPCPRPVFTYSFDSMGRPVALNQTAPDSRGVASDVVYNAAGLVTSMKTWTGGYRQETRQYNPLQQLTRLTMAFNGTTKLDYEYRFSSTQNDGRITQRKDWLSGEEVEYQYDSLQRLSSSATTGSGGWGQSFGYDGFGNLLSQTVTKGNAPSMSVSVNPATNRITNQGTSYDANGNLTAMPGLTMTYDMTNRMISATSDSNGTDTYVYDPAGHRVFRNGYLDFYGVDGSLLGEYSPGWPDGFTACNVSVYFGKRMLWRGWGYNFFTSGETINADRLGSAVYDWTDAPKYFPYGDEPTTTQQNRPKFATYTRDATTALDYAQQRYYASTLGRFTTPDLSGLGAAGSEPQSWNRYAYVENDPANFNDPTGELRWLDSLDGGGVYVLPIVFVVNVFRSIFGGGPKDPAILWKLSAATEVRKWDQKIADAIKKGEEDEQKRRYVKALWVVDDCYERNRLGMPIRRITYMAKDQSDQPFQRGEYVVAEQQYVVKGSLTGRGVWGYTQQNPDGTFDDFIGLQAPWVAEVTTYQTFTATMVNPTGYLPGVPRPVMVVYPGYPNGPYFGVLGHWMSKAGDRMNGAWGDPAGRRDCTTPRYSGI